MTNVACHSELCRTGRFRRDSQLTFSIRYFNYFPNYWPEQFLNELFNFQEQKISLPELRLPQLPLAIVIKNTIIFWCNW